MIVPDFDHMSQFDREQLMFLAEDIHRIARLNGHKMTKNGIAAEVALALFNLGTAVRNFSKMNGTMAIWAAFTPTMFAEEEGSQHEETEG